MCCVLYDERVCELIQYFQYSYQNRMHVPSIVYIYTIRPNRIWREKTHAVFIYRPIEMPNTKYWAKTRSGNIYLDDCEGTSAHIFAKAHLYQIRVAVSKHQLMKTHIKKNWPHLDVAKKKKILFLWRAGQPEGDNGKIALRSFGR